MKLTHQELALCRLALNTHNSSDKTIAADMAALSEKIKAEITCQPKKWIPEPLEEVITFSSPPYKEEFKTRGVSVKSIIDYVTTEALKAVKAEIAR